MKVYDVDFLKFTLDYNRYFINEYFWLITILKFYNIYDIPENILFIYWSNMDMNK